MEFHLARNIYTIENPGKIATPRLCIFEQRVDDNIGIMQKLLQNIHPTYNLAKLCPHVKTHKSIYITQKMLHAGIYFFKCTMNEIDMLVDAGAEQIFIAYPLMQHDAEKVAALSEQYPDIRFYVQTSCSEHAEILYRFKRTHWHYFIDANVGMNRTGLPAENAFALYQYLQKYKDRLHFVGIHAYDGHVHQVDAKERRQTAFASMQRLEKCVQNFAENNVDVNQIIVAGTPGFLYDAKFFSGHALQEKVRFSPGTWVLFDSQSAQFLPETFYMAAFILAQIIDRPTDATATLNLGHKRWAVDQGAIELLSISGAQVESWSEEHTTIRLPENYTAQIGEYVLLAPKHVCSTVNLWEFAALIDKNGRYSQNLSIDARNR